LERRTLVDSAAKDETLEREHGRAEIDQEAAGEWSGRWDEY